MDDVAEEAATLIALSAVARDCPKDMLDHLIVHAFSFQTAKQACEDFRAKGFWRSPHGSAWGEVMPSE